MSPWFIAGVVIAVLVLSAGSYIALDLRRGRRLCRQPACGHVSCAGDLDKRARLPVSVPALARDGEPLTSREKRILSDIEMDALIKVAEPVYDRENPR